MRRVLELSETAGLRAGSAFTLYAVACLHFLTGEYPRALELCRQAVAAYQGIGDRVGEAVAWEGRGQAHREMGHHRQALICYQRTLRLRREIGDRYLEADSMLRIGDIHEAAGRLDAARSAWLSAHQILSELSHPEADAVKMKIESGRSVPADSLPAGLENQQAFLQGLTPDDEVPAGNVTTWRCGSRTAASPPAVLLRAGTE